MRGVGVKYGTGRNLIASFFLHHFTRKWPVHSSQFQKESLYRFQSSDVSFFSLNLVLIRRNKTPPPPPQSLRIPFLIRLFFHLLHSTRLGCTLYHHKTEPLEQTLTRPTSSLMPSHQSCSAISSDWVWLLGQRRQSKMEMISKWKAEAVEQQQQQL